METNEKNVQFQMMQLIAAKWIGKPIYIAAELGIADILSNGPKDIDEICHLTGSQAPGLYRVMRALSSVGIFREVEGKAFELTPMAEMLKTGAMRSIAMMLNSEWHNRAWDKLPHSIQTGEIAFDSAFGVPAMEWLKANSEAADILSKANSAKAMMSHSAIVDFYDFSGIKNLIDIGGGYGGLMIKILENNSHIQGVIADLPHVIKKTEKIIEEATLTERCSVISCDFFKEIPWGSDAFILSHILHDFDDERCCQILANCHRAMHADAKLLVVEMLVPPGNEPSVSKLLDLEVMVMGGGMERSEEQFRQLFESLNFKLIQIIPTGEEIGVLECMRK